MSKRILAADDSRTIQHALAITFKHVPQFELRLALNGQHMLQRLKDESFDLLLLDHQLPDFELTELCQKIREELQLHSLPIVILAGKKFNPQQLQKLGLQGMIRKPFLTEELLEKVAEPLTTEYTAPPSLPTYYDAPPIIEDDEDDLEFDEPMVLAPSSNSLHAIDAIPLGEYQAQKTDAVTAFSPPKPPPLPKQPLPTLTPLPLSIRGEQTELTPAPNQPPQNPKQLHPTHPHQFHLNPPQDEEEEISLTAEDLGTPFPQSKMPSNQPALSTTKARTPAPTLPVVPSSQAPHPPIPPSTQHSEEQTLADLSSPSLPEIPVLTPPPILPEDFDTPLTEPPKPSQQDNTIPASRSQSASSSHPFLPKIPTTVETQDKKQPRTKPSSSHPSLPLLPRVGNSSGELQSIPPAPPSAGPTQDFSFLDSTNVPPPVGPIENASLSDSIEMVPAPEPIGSVPSPGPIQTSNIPGFPEQSGLFPPPLPPKAPKSNAAIHASLEQQPISKELLSKTSLEAALQNKTAHKHKATTQADVPYSLPSKPAPSQNTEPNVRPTNVYFHIGPPSTTTPLQDNDLIIPFLPPDEIDETTEFSVSSDGKLSAVDYAFSSQIDDSTDENSPADDDASLKLNDLSIPPSPRTPLPVLAKQDPKSNETKNDEPTGQNKPSAEEEQTSPSEQSPLIIPIPSFPKPKELPSSAQPESVLANIASPLEQESYGSLDELPVADEDENTTSEPSLLEFEVEVDLGDLQEVDLGDLQNDEDIDQAKTEPPPTKAPKQPLPLPLTNSLKETLDAVPRVVSPSSLTRQPPAENRQSKEFGAGFELELETIEVSDDAFPIPNANEKPKEQALTFSEESLTTIKAYEHDNDDEFSEMPPMPGPMGLPPMPGPMGDANSYSSLSMDELPLNASTYSSLSMDELPSEGEFQSFQKGGYSPTKDTATANKRITSTRTPTDFSKVSLPCPPDHVQVVLGTTLEISTLALITQFIEHCKQRLLDHMQPQGKPGIYMSCSYPDGQTMLTWGGDPLLLRILLPAFLECFGTLEDHERQAITQAIHDTTPATQQKQVSQFHLRILMSVRPYASVLQDLAPVLQRIPLRNVSSSLVHPTQQLHADLRELETVSNLNDPRQARRNMLAKNIQHSFSIAQLRKLLLECFDIRLSHLVPLNLPQRCIYQAVQTHFEQRYQLANLANVLHAANPHFDATLFKDL